MVIPDPSLVPVCQTGVLSRGGSETSASAGRPGTLPAMTEPAPTPEVEVPPLPPERLAEIREAIDRVRRGDYSETVTWDEIAAET